MTTLIRNVYIVSGGRRSLERQDVFVSGNKISAIGSFPQRIADEVIDAQGAYLAPGFIDINTDSDHYLSLFSNPQQDDFLRQGVTTIIGGQCGASLAPLLYGSLESIQKWVDINKVNTNWHLVAEFLETLEKQKLGVNFGTLVGHSTVRRALLGESLRPLTENEFKVFESVLEQAMLEGAFGFSTGLAYIHSFDTPEEEIKRLLQTIKKREGVYATHLRKTGADLTESVQNTIALARGGAIPTIISHHLPLQGFEDQYRQSLEMIHEASSQVSIYFDLYPFDVSVLPLYTFLPQWAKNGGIDVMNANISDEWLSKKILKDLPAIEGSNFTVARAGDNHPLVGYSLTEIQELYGLKTGAEAILKLMQVTRLKASIFFRNVNLGLVKEALKSSQSIVASNAASFSEALNIKKPDRASKTFTTFLKMVEKENLMTLEEAVRKITQLPASIYGLKDRGEVKEGFVADLACFKEGEIKLTMVGGEVAYRDDEIRKEFPRRSGKVLRHHDR
ncbi:MAG: amidohydrolase family protein [Anaplasmataceae bacterium]|nr:amidohydrolase family protein [Anaplasmataceae bacterium]